MTEPADKRGKHFKREFHGRTEAEATANLQAWKKQVAKTVSIIAQIVAPPTNGLGTYVIHVKYVKDA